MTKKAKKIFFKEATKDGIMSNKKFWSTVKPFLTNKGGISNDFITVEKDGDLISNEKEIVELFNQNYINIVENSSGKKPSSLGDCLNASQDERTVKEIISVYSNHPSIQEIKVSLIPTVNLIFQNQLQVISTKQLSLLDQMVSLPYFLKCQPMSLTVIYPK